MIIIFTEMGRRDLLTYCEVARVFHTINKFLMLLYIDLGGR